MRYFIILLISVYVSIITLLIGSVRLGSTGEFLHS
jgi:hypothetical protein